MSENKKPTGPTPPDGYRWVPKGQIVWPTDCMTLHAMDMKSNICAAACATDWMPAQLEFQWFRAKVTQPDLVWLKSKAVKHGESITDPIEREKVRWLIAQAVQLYAETLMSLIPEQERYRPDQMKGGEA